MKRMFAHNELTRRIMTLHGDTDDILYGCKSVYKTAQKENLNLPRYFKKMNIIFDALNKVK